MIHPVRQSIVHPAVNRSPLGCGAVVFVAHRQRFFLIGSFEMRSLLSSFLSDQSGATAIEYALVAMGISIVIVAAVNGIGTNLNSTFTQVSTSIK